MARILKEAVPCAPHERSVVLENNPDLEKVHTAIALQGQTAVPEHPDDEVDHHYTCFVQSAKSGHLYELDGDNKGPIDLGPLLGESEDMLSPKALDAVRRSHLNGEEYGSFSLLALCETSC